MKAFSPVAPHAEGRLLDGRRDGNRWCGPPWGAEHGQGAEAINGAEIGLQVFCLILNRLALLNLREAPLSQPRCLVRWILFGRFHE